jgi:membrane-associated protease RseP (regulator of RpoE activity)
MTVTIERGDETLDIELSVDVAQTLFGGGFAFGREIMPDNFNFRINPRGFDGRSNNFTIRPNQGIQLGVQFVSLNESSAEEYDTDQTSGAYVAEVLAGSLAEEAGLQVGDVIIAVSGDVIDEERTLRDRILAYEPGDTITLEVIRDGETMEVEITFPAPIESSDAGSEFGFALPQGDIFTFGMPEGFEDIMIFPEFGNGFALPDFQGRIFEFDELPEFEFFADPQI